MSEYDEKMNALVMEKINKIESDWIAGRLDAESMIFLLKCSRAGMDMARAAGVISKTSKALADEMEIKVFRSELETAEKVGAAKESTAVVLEKLAEDFDEWSGNIEYNNRHTKRLDWEGRMKAFREAAEILRRKKRELTGNG